MSHIGIVSPLKKDLEEKGAEGPLDEDEGEPEQPDDDGFDDDRGLTIIIQNVESLSIFS